MHVKYSIASIAACAVLTIPASAFAQSFDWRTASAAKFGYVDERLSYYDARREAYDEGYREGAKAGERDARRGERFRYEDERTYQRADRGYHRGYGDVERYRQAFRSGFASGYSDSYRRFARGPRYEDRGRSGSDRYGDSRYGNGYPRGGATRPGYSYASPALDNGLHDGYEKGLEDARKNRSFDPRRHAWYREGDRHYNGRYGPREVYKDEYRRAFQEGYDRGYRDGRYRR